MSQPARLLDERVTQLESEMAEVRFLATKADREVSDVQVTLRGYTGTLNAIRDDQVEQGKRLARVETKVDNLEKEVHTGFVRVDENFAKVDENFAKVERKFELLHKGQEQITELLTRRLDEETHTGDADE